MKHCGKFLLAGILLTSGWVGYSIDQANASVGALENTVPSSTISGVCDPSMGFSCKDETCTRGNWILPQGQGGQFTAGSRKFISTHSTKYKCKPKPVTTSPSGVETEVPIEEIIPEPGPTCTESSTSCGQFVYYSDRNCTSLAKLTFDGYFHGCTF